ncbi:hypothetical protein O3M35_000825 [Rhynocoris fuscipes]|uniref:Uncharacterized protein n=1 Tax=Rhynocoris fuscipes TaxID=488301 RepID=A0AAW1DP12_9HEMI
MDRRTSFPGQRVPGVTEYAARHSISGSSIPNVLEAVRNFDAEDHKLLKFYGSLPKEALIQELKKLHDQAYKLGLEESKEMTRGKYLNILTSTARRK